VAGKPEAKRAGLGKETDSRTPDRGENSLRKDGPRVFFPTSWGTDQKGP